MASLRIKLQACDIEVQNYVAALEAENLKLTKQITKFQVDNVTLNNRVKSFIEQYKADKREFIGDALSVSEETELIAKAEHEASKRDVSRFLKKSPSSK